MKSGAARSCPMRRSRSTAWLPTSSAIPSSCPGARKRGSSRGDDREVTVTLGLSSGIARASFTTRNRLEPRAPVTMSLVDGPFDHLEGRWDFTPIGGTRHARRPARAVLDPRRDRRARARPRVRGHLQPPRRCICAPRTAGFRWRAERIAIVVACAEADRQIGAGARGAGGLHGGRGPRALRHPRPASRDRRGGLRRRDLRARSGRATACSRRATVSRCCGRWRKIRASAGDGWRGRAAR